MGQGRRRRGPALASAGQRPVRRASLRLRRSRPAALGPRGLRLAGPRLQGCLAGQGRRHARRRGWVTPPPGMCGRPALAGRGRRHAVRGGQGPPQPGTRWRPALAGRGRRRAGCGGRGTTTARHPRAPRSGPPRSTTRRPRGSGTAAARHTRAPPIGPAEVARQHAAEKGGEVKNGACHLSRNNA